MSNQLIGFVTVPGDGKGYQVTFQDWKLDRIQQKLADRGETLRLSKQAYIQPAAKAIVTPVLKQSELPPLSKKGKRKLRKISNTGAPATKRRLAANGEVRPQYLQMFRAVVNITQGTFHESVKAAADAVGGHGTAITQYIKRDNANRRYKGCQFRYATTVEIQSKTFIPA